MNIGFSLHKTTNTLVNRKVIWMNQALLVYKVVFSRRIERMKSSRLKPGCWVLGTGCFRISGINHSDTPSAVINPDGGFMASYFVGKQSMRELAFRRKAIISLHNNLAKHLFFNQLQNK